MIFCAGNSPDLTLCRCASGSSSIRPSGDPLPMWLCPDSDFTSCRSRIKLHLPQCRSFADAALSRLGFHKLSLMAAPVVRMRTCMKKCGIRKNFTNISNWACAWPSESEKAVLPSDSPVCTQKERLFKRDAHSHQCHPDELPCRAATAVPVSSASGSAAHTYAAG